MNDEWNYRIVRKTALVSGNCNGVEGMIENGLNIHWEIVRECLKCITGMCIRYENDEETKGLILLLIDMSWNTLHQGLLLCVDMVLNDEF